MSAESDSLIEVKADFGYDGRVVVRVPLLRLAAGSCLGVYGPNGSGKSTLLRGVTGLLAPLEGSVRRAGGLRVGYLGQHRDLQLHWPMTARDAAQLALSARRPLGRVRGTGPLLDPWLRALGVEGLARRSFATLSGGQQQRVLLAGALAAGPQVLVLDEPTEGLDMQSRRVLLECLRRGIGEGLSVVLVSHEVGDLLAVAGRAVVLEPAAESGGASAVVAVEPSHLLEHLAATGAANAQGAEVRP